MRAMIMDRVCAVDRTEQPLRPADLPRPDPGEGEVLLKVAACGVCHTELDEIEGRTPPPTLPVVPGHQVVGRVLARGEGVDSLAEGDRVGVAWIHSACGRCDLCRAGQENLCADFVATGRDAHGGYAEFMTVPAAFAHKIPEQYSDAEAAPLLCAGAIGYRSLRLSGLIDGQRLGLTGFGASAHLVLKMVRHRFPAAETYVFARSERERAFSRELGAVWAGDTTDTPPKPLHATIDTTPAWLPVVHGLRTLAPGGRLVINAIRKEESDKAALLGLDYPEHLWMEKEVKSVANVARRDVAEFLAIAAEIGIKPKVQRFSLDQANVALRELKMRKIEGAKVLILNE